MKKWMQQWKNKYAKDGSSLVSAVIGLVFLTSLGMIVLLISSQFLKSVIVDNNATNNFYDAEGVLSEVRAGIMEYASDASEYAYKDVLNRYSELKSKQKKEYAREYISYIEHCIKNNGDASSFDWSTVTWKEDEIGSDKEKTASIESLKKLTKKRDSVTTAYAKASGADPNVLKYTIETSKKNYYTITFKGVKIDLTNEADYNSTITTDICVRVPDMKFEGDSTINQIKDYIVIADDSLEVTGSLNTFTGNVYTGAKDEGIHIAGNSNAVFNSDTIISRGDLVAKTDSNVSIAGENDISGDLWLHNIIVAPTNPDKIPAIGATATQLSLQANSYIENDLDIRDDNSIVTLKGKYYGYSYNKTNSVAESGTEYTSQADADYSSAILINGLNTTLNADSSLEKLELAGRSFVSRINHQDTSSYKQQGQDIQMGESVSVKSNQTAYMVPNEYMMPKHNPIGDAEYVEYNDPYNKLSSNTGSKKSIVDIDKLKKSDIWKYLDPSKPYTANFNNVCRYVYFYLNFKNEAKANAYFEHYYKNTTHNDGRMEEMADRYIANGLQLNYSPTLAVVAANILKNYNENADKTAAFESENYFRDSKPDSALLANENKFASRYVSLMLGLTGSANPDNKIRIEDVGSGDRDTIKPLVSETLIDPSKITQTLTREIKEKDETGTEYLVGNIYVKDGDYTLETDIEPGILIVKGNVSVKKDFRGLIIATGKVTTSGGVTLTSDMTMVSKLMDYIETDEDIKEIFRAYSSDSQSKEPLKNLIGYKNWKRNE